MPWLIGLMASIFYAVAAYKLTNAMFKNTKFSFSIAVIVGYAFTYYEWTSNSPMKWFTYILIGVPAIIAFGGLLSIATGNTKT